MPLSWTKLVCALTDIGSNTPQRNVNTFANTIAQMTAPLSSPPSAI